MIDTGGYSLNTNCYRKGTLICKYFCEIKFLDSVLCSYPHENKAILTRSYDR
jgi:hypothetical protein